MFGEPIMNLTIESSKKVAEMMNEGNIAEQIGIGWNSSMPNMDSLVIADG